MRAGPEETSPGTCEDMNSAGLGNNSAAQSLAVGAAKSFPRTITFICFNALHGRALFFQSSEVHA